MEAITLTVQRREGAGRSSAQAARRRGHVPAVVYGRGSEPAVIEVDARELERFLRDHGHSAIVQFKLGNDDDTMAMIKEIQRQPVSRAVVHVDFLRVSLDEPVEMTVPLQFVGEAPGTTYGGVVEHSLVELAIRCSPRNLPDVVVVDESGLNIGDRLTAGQLALPEGVELVTPADELVTLCGEPSVAKEDDEAPQAIEDAPSAEQAQAEDQARRAVE
jgi:large subunit ribosomal protein L25